jgi:hypothetical protein
MVSNLEVFDVQGDRAVVRHRDLLRGHAPCHEILGHLAPDEIGGVFQVHEHSLEGPARELGLRFLWALVPDVELETNRRLVGVSYSGRIGKLDDECLRASGAEAKCQQHE